MSHVSNCYIFMYRHFVWLKPEMFEQMSILVGKCLMSDHYFKHCYNNDK